MLRVLLVKVEYLCVMVAYSAYFISLGSVAQRTDLNYRLHKSSCKGSYV